MACWYHQRCSRKSFGLSKLVSACLESVETCLSSLQLMPLSQAILVHVLTKPQYIASAFLGCWCSDPLNFYLGRRGAIFISAIILILAPIGSAVCQTWEQLFVCRLILGIGMGLKGSTTPIFAAENSPAAIRGALVMTWQLWTAFGILLGTAANLAVYDVGSISWRLQLGSAFIPAVPLAIFVYMCPESPRWVFESLALMDRS